MPILSNDRARQESMQEFLHAMHISADNINISSIEGLFCFNSNNKDQAEIFTEQLQKAIQGDGQPEQIRRLSFAEILKEEITEAKCEKAVHKHSCLRLLSVLQDAGVYIAFLQDSGKLEITFPDDDYYRMFIKLNYPNLKFSGNGKAILDIKPYLAKYPDEKIFSIENTNPDSAPVLLLNSSAMEHRIFYAIDVQEDGSSSVQPFFFVPASSTPPNYHFVLDTSSSMVSSLHSLKRSVLKLAEQLFDFQPNACIRIVTFPSDKKVFESFTIADDLQFSSAVNSMHAQGFTPLYQTTNDLLDLIDRSNVHNNVLLFSDGHDTSNSNFEDHVKSKLSSLEQNPSRKVKNKFTVFSYNIKPDNLLRSVAESFSSEVIETDNADFMSALQDPQLMKNWAAARSLFKSTLTVKSDDQQKQEVYQVSIDHCGQLAKLNPVVCKQGETFDIRVEDGDGNMILDGHLEFPAMAKPGLEAQQPSVVAALNNHGFLAPKEKDNQESGSPVCVIS